MNKHMTLEIRELMESAHYHPCVSIIMPFEPKMNVKAVLFHSLEKTADKVEMELIDNYPDEIVSLVMKKLRDIIQNLNSNTHKKSIAIYVSPVFEKVIYLDVGVEEKIIIDESFEIRDVVYNKKQLRNYLVLLLSGNESHIYLGDTISLKRIVSNTPETILAYMNEVPEKVANFSDMSDRKEIMMEKFLRHIDNSLNIILNADRLPVFVLAPERIGGHFKKITRNEAAVIEYVHGNYDEATMEELKQVLKPHLDNWNEVIQKKLLKQLEDAANKKQLASGMKEVWREAVNRNGRLLVVEKDYIYTEEEGSSNDLINKASKPYHKYSNVKDAVDDVIEKVLENGGDVEFVDNNELKGYQQIALVLYY